MVLQLSPLPDLTPPQQLLQAAAPRLFPFLPGLGMELLVAEWAQLPGQDGNPRSELTRLTR